MKLWQTAYLWLLLASSALAVHPFKKVWENTQYSKTVDVAKSYIKERHDIQVTNIDSEPVKQYIFGIPKETEQDASLVIAIYQAKNGKKSILQPSKLPIVDNEVLYYDLKFPYPIAPGSTFEFVISVIMINQFTPYPEHIPMQGQQTLKFLLPAYPLSPYDTQSYSLNIAHSHSLEALNMEDLEVPLLKTEEKTVISYFTKDTIKGNMVDQLAFTTARNAPLQYVNYLQRDLWVSHWSQVIQLEEYYELTNHAAGLDKGFSRATYMAEGLPTKLTHAINSLRIPFDTTKQMQYDSIYYVDKVGNVSTSQYYDSELIVRPRFPLFGGWNYNFTLGWNYNLDQFVKQDKEEFILNANILDGMQDTTYGKVQFSIYLPEGAELIDYALPFAVAEPVVTHKHSYLDVNDGHLKVTFEFENLVDEMKNLSIVLRYRYTTAAMLHKPLQAAFYIFLALMGLYVLKKIDLSIKPMEAVKKVKEVEETEK